jgi:2-phosphoglycerate kinase
MARRELYVVRGDAKYAYSMGDVVESLQAAGVMTDEAMRIARDVEKHFRERGERSIPLDAMVEEISAQIETRVDEPTASRFRHQTPPFVPISVERENGTELFSRRTLASSLERLDLGFKEAHSIAHQVAQGLRSEGHEVVTERDLAHRVALSLEARYGREMRLRYEASVSQTTDLFIVENGQELPYSRGILAQSLMAIGLGPELSHNLAKRIEDVLWRRGEVRVERDDLRAEVRSILFDEAGEEFARRYDLMRAVRRPERPVVVLIGGAAGVGKSAVASELGYRLGIPRIVSSDPVRQALRSLISPELSPVLHASTYTAWLAELLPT